MREMVLVLPDGAVQVMELPDPPHCRMGIIDLGGGMVRYVPVEDDADAE